MKNRLKEVMTRQATTHAQLTEHSGLASAVVKTLLWLVLAVALLVLDQATKSLASGALRYGEQVFVTPYFNWTMLHNTGAAFSFLSDAGGWQNGFFCGVALLISTAIIYWLYRAPPAAHWQNLALTLVLGGALGNLYDRLTLGYVIDFIQLHYQGYYWPAFNVADAGITVGAVILVLTSILTRDSDG